MAWGLLTGKFDDGADPAERRGARLTDSPSAGRMMNPKNLAIAAEISSLAREWGCPPAQLSLAWLLRRPEPKVIPIIGARTEHQVRENIGALELHLDADQIARLDELTAPEARYPRSLLNSDAFQTMMFGEQRTQIEMLPPRI